MRVLCASISGPGHGYPMLAVAHALSSRGHEVMFVSGTLHVDDAARAGCSFREMPIVFGSEHHDLRPYEDSENLARAFVPVIDDEKPEALVADLITLGPALAAEVRGVPHASLLVHPLHTPSRFLPPFGWGRPPARGLLKGRDAWLRAANRHTLRRARKDLNVARGRLGLAPLKRLDGQLSERLVLVATLPALEIPRPDWPPQAYVIGPCLWDAGGPTPELPAGDAPLVLIAASTAHEQGALVDAALDAVASLRLRGLVTLGESVLGRQLPSDVTAAAFVPHERVLPRCAAVICNGGHGIVARALSHGVPVVVVPGHGDQQENGYRVERAQAGIRLMQPRARELKKALRRLLSDERYARAARRIALEAALLNGPVRAAELVEEMATT